MFYILKFLDESIEKSSGEVYFYTLAFLHASYVLAFFDIINLNEGLMNYLDIFIHTLICVVLLVRFNPWRKTVLTQGDRHIIFGSAIFLLGNLAITQYFLNYVKTNYVAIK